MEMKKLAWVSLQPSSFTRLPGSGSRGFISTHADTLAEYVEALAGQIITDMLKDEVEDRKLGPGLLDATIDIDSYTPTIN